MNGKEICYGIIHRNFYFIGGSTTWGEYQGMRVNVLRQVTIITQIIQYVYGKGMGLKVKEYRGKRKVFLEVK